VRVASLGERGEGWVVGQFALFAAVAVSWFLPPRWPEAVSVLFSGLGAAMAFVGLALLFSAYRELGPGFTPLPRPREDSRVVESGPYRYIRHPIYAGGLLFFTGVALGTSLTALVLTAGLAALWAGKLEVEERWLEQQFPDYAEYRRDTPWRLVPGVF
jgi:protein-S-isoprenylcysteine O-methyltransferase Ste14